MILISNFFCNVLCLPFCFVCFSLFQRYRQQDLSFSMHKLPTMPTTSNSNLKQPNNRPNKLITLNRRRLYFYLQHKRTERECLIVGCSEPSCFLYSPTISCVYRIHVTTVISGLKEDMPPPPFHTEHKRKSPENCHTIKENGITLPDDGNRSMSLMQYISMRKRGRESKLHKQYPFKQHNSLSIQHALALVSA